MRFLEDPAVESVVTWPTLFMSATLPDVTLDVWSNVAPPDVSETMNVVVVNEVAIT